MEVKLSSHIKYALLLSRKYNFEKAFVKTGIPPNIIMKYYNEYSRYLENRDLRIKLIEDLLKSGFSPEDVAEAIDWRDFEYLVDVYLRNHGYITIRGFKLKKPPREYDVIGIRERIVLCIDCKNWNRYIDRATLKIISDRHLERCKYLCNLSKYIGLNIIPTIIVMRSLKPIFNNCIIISIIGFKDLLANIEYLIATGVVKYIRC